MSMAVIRYIAQRQRLADNKPYGLIHVCYDTQGNGLLTYCGQPVDYHFVITARSYATHEFNCKKCKEAILPTMETNNKELE